MGYKYRSDIVVGISAHLSEWPASDRLECMAAERLIGVPD